MINLEFKDEKTANLTEKCEQELFGGKWDKIRDYDTNDNEINYYTRNAIAFIQKKDEITYINGNKLRGEVMVRQYLDEVSGGGMISTAICQTKNSVLEFLGRSYTGSKNLTPEEFANEHS